MWITFVNIRSICIYMWIQRGSGKKTGIKNQRHISLATRAKFIQWRIQSNTTSRAWALRPTRSNFYLVHYNLPRAKQGWKYKKCTYTNITREEWKLSSRTIEKNKRIYLQIYIFLWFIRFSEFTAIFHAFVVEKWYLISFANPTDSVVHPTSHISQIEKRREIRWIATSIDWAALKGKSMTAGIPFFSTPTHSTWHPVESSWNKNLFCTCNHCSEYKSCPFSTSGFF